MNRIVNIVDEMYIIDTTLERKWIEMDRNGFILFVSNPDSDLLNPFLLN